MAFLCQPWRRPFISASLTKKAIPAQLLGLIRPLVLVESITMLKDTAHHLPAIRKHHPLNSRMAQILTMRHRSNPIVTMSQAAI
ncbi:hypothetical protein AA15669_1142 [Saccharibacter floricola DSM 15669]|uniref:Uncharacterized protein n=1 Tax=Saccharibacter floricola DSM 15669 TaxID=1123227 RepID=A0ABQ0NYV8_9PROT|nr:hypothetical protein AA15669_1142 [Saccharibacter floricola DSM 15669]